MRDYLTESIKHHEGFRTRAYQDTVGVWTIGYGQNLQVLEVDEATAARWLHVEIAKARKAAESFPEWPSLDGPRQDVVVEMIYNLGRAGYAGFANTRRAMQEQRWDDAANGMLLSKWATQVGRRSKRLAQQMRTGKRWQDAQENE